MIKSIDVVFSQRFERVRAAMASAGVEVMLLSVGADLPWLSGYYAMPLERLTMLVVPLDAQPTMFVPRLEVPRVVQHGDHFSIQGWDESEDPVRLVGDAVGAATSLAIGDQTWSRFLVDLMAELPQASWQRASVVMSPLRAVKDEAEIAGLRQAAEAVDRIAAALQAGEIPLIGRSEAAVSAELTRRIVEEGHSQANFAIVAAGKNAASPHHEPGSRIITSNEVVLCDFGGTFPTESGVGYCSDITRCVYTGEVDETFAKMYAVLQHAQAESVAAATVGTPVEDVDAVARQLIDAGGYGGLFIHRIGHGIGVEAHEDPYLVAGNREPLVAGNAFSIEPGIYVPDLYGARIEDIVVATNDGPMALNVANHDLVVVEA